MPGFGVGIGLGEDEVQELIDASIPGGMGGDMVVGQYRTAVPVTDIPLAWSDVAYELTDIENDDTVIDKTSNTTIELKDAGVYWAFVRFNFDDELQLRATLDGVDIPQSNAVDGDPTDGTGFDMSTSTGFLFEAAANQELSIQIQASTTIEQTLLINGVVSTLSVVRMSGPKGDKGDPGSGSTVTVNGNVVDTVDFNLSDFEVVIAGSTATVSAKNFKASVVLADPVGVDLNNSGFEQALRLTVNVPRTGNYKIDAAYVWSVDSSTASDFVLQLDQDDGTVLYTHQQEPKDVGGTGIVVDDLQGGTFNSGTDQRVPTSWHTVVALTAGVHTFDLDIRDDAGDTDKPVLYSACMTLEEWA